VLIVNLLNGVFLASLVCFIVGTVLLAILAGRSASPASPPSGARRIETYEARLRAAFSDPRFRIGRTLILAGAVAGVVSVAAVFVLSATLPRCATTSTAASAVSMCMPVAPATTA